MAIPAIFESYIYTAFICGLG